MTAVTERNNINVIGDGDIPMVFAHGFGCDQNVWRYVVKAYQANYKCILFDFVGAGKSNLSAYNSKKYSSLDGYAQDILDVCESLNLKNVIFIGHSVSCMSGVRAALLKPDYFSKLILVTPSPCYINDGDYIGGMENSDITDLLAMMDDNYLGWSSTMAPLVIGNPERPELGGELTRNFCSTDPKIAKEFARVTFLSDSRVDLQQLKVPSLTIQCENDILAPLAVGYYIKKNTPCNTLTILNASGHCPHLSAPAETIEAINAYLQLPATIEC